MDGGRGRMAYRWEFFLQLFPRRRTTGSLGDRPGHVRVRPGRDVPNDRVTGARTTGSHTPPLGSRPGCRELRARRHCRRWSSYHQNISEIIASNIIPAAYQKSCSVDTTKQ